MRPRELEEEVLTIVLTVDEAITTLTALKEAGEAVTRETADAVTAKLDAAVEKWGTEG